MDGQDGWCLQPVRGVVSLLYYLPTYLPSPVLLRICTTTTDMAARHTFLFSTLPPLLSHTSHPTLLGRLHTENVIHPKSDISLYAFLPPHHSPTTPPSLPGRFAAHCGSLGWRWALELPCLFTHTRLLRAHTQHARALTYTTTHYHAPTAVFGRHGVARAFARTEKFVIGWKTCAVGGCYVYGWNTACWFF